MDIAQQAPETVIVAEDEATLYLQATTTSVWAPKGQTPVVAVHPDRQKVSFYGSLNLATGQVVSSRVQTMNSKATAEHLHLLLQTYPDRPILLLWDRARWHGGATVNDLLAAHPRLEVMNFPPASPDLNPQEQVWKATRMATSHNHDQRKLETLADRFEQHLLSNTFSSSLLHKHNYFHICATFK